MTSVRPAARSSVSSRRRAPLFFSGNPTNVNSRVGNPDATSAAIAAPDLVPRDVHHQIRAMEDLAAAGISTPKQCADPRQELVVRERLDEIVVGARIEPGDAIGDGVARGEHQDGQIRSVAQSPADLHAVDAGEHDVEYDEIGRPIAR